MRQGKSSAKCTDEPQIFLESSLLLPKGTQGCLTCRQSLPRNRVTPKQRIEAKPNRNHSEVNAVKEHTAVKSHKASRCKVDARWIRCFREDGHGNKAPLLVSVCVSETLRT